MVTRMTNDIISGSVYSPVISMQPMVDEMLHDRQAGTIFPTVGVECRGPAHQSKPVVQVLNCDVGDADLKGVDRHRLSDRVEPTRLRIG